MPNQQQQDEREPTIGDNGHVNEKQAEKLKKHIGIIERLDEQKRSFGSDIANEYRAAKDNGFDTKAMRAVVKLRRMEADARELHLTKVDAYREALGELSDLPLGRAAMQREGLDPRPAA